MPTKLEFLQKILGKKYNGFLRELFAQQEKERFKLRTKHIVEKEKLVLAVEQASLSFLRGNILIVRYIFYAEIIVGKSCFVKFWVAYNFSFKHFCFSFRKIASNT